jgi:hypothetical protein
MPYLAVSLILKIMHRDSINFLVSLAPHSVGYSEAEIEF